MTFFTVPDASCMMRRPTSVEPVNATLSTSGCCAISSPALPPGPVMRLTTPAGMSASSHAFTISIADSDVKLAGFNTAQLPAAIAGAIFQPAMRNGKFHGTMPVHTPNGSRRTMLFAGGNGLSPRSMTSASFSAQPAKNSNVEHRRERRRTSPS